MTKKKYCPLIKEDCLEEKCGLWVFDCIRVTNLKTHKSDKKDNSGCAISKLGEDACMRMWAGTEKLIDEGEPDEHRSKNPYEHCSRNPNDSCPHMIDGTLDIPSCRVCEFWKD